MLLLPLRGSRGSTILLLLGTIAIFAAISLEIYRRSKDTEVRGRHTNLIDHSELIRQAIEANLKDPEVCLRTLVGAKPTPGEATIPKLNFIYDPEVDPHRTQTTQGDVVSQGIELELLTLELDSQPDMRTRIGDQDDSTYKLKAYRRYPARLHTGFRATAGSESLLIDRKESFYVWLDDEGTLTSCFGRNSAGFLCNELGGYFEAGKKDHSQSCRQSIYSERSKSDGNWRSIGSCRTAGVVESKAQCIKKMGNEKVQTVAVQEPFKRFLPKGPKASMLCMLCY